MYYKFIEELGDICNKKNIILEKIGSTGIDNEFPLYAIKVNSEKQNKNICFSAGIHGYETAGPLAILEFIKTYNFNKLPGNVGLIIYPVANPTGYDKNKRRNYKKKDLNRHFCKPELEDENKILYDYIKNESIHFFHALHEDVDEKQFYMYVQGKKQIDIDNIIIQTAKKYFPINTSEKIYKDSFKNGIGYNIKDGSFEDRLYRDGIQFAICTETPGKESINKRTELNVEIMKNIISFLS